MSIGPLTAGCFQAAILSLKWHASGDCSVGAGRGYGDGAIAARRDDRLAGLDNRCVLYDNSPERQKRGNRVGLQSCLAQPSDKLHLRSVADRDVQHEAQTL